MRISACTSICRFCLSLESRGTVAAARDPGRSRRRVNREAERRMELKGRWVQFAIRDIYFPGPDVVLHELHGGDLLSGQIIDVSDSGTDPDAFVVVTVEGLESPVVVAVSRIHDYIDRQD